ncbi:MAG: TetR/AcrR family transcriptional regulator [Emcibacteraceae bacterium]|nr:TetR/AcrR family transcriptional regulator [Emcibacteraceae bacterium]
MNKKPAVGRPREFDKDKVLKIIMNLFWEHGYDATSLSDIISSTGLKKGSLYAAFGDKHAMYLSAIDHYESSVVDPAKFLLSSGEEEAVLRIEQFLNAPMKSVGKKNDRRGCFLCNASSDRAALDKETSILVKRGFEKLEAGMVKALKELSPKSDENELAKKARWLLATYAGFRVMVRSGLSILDLEHALEDTIQTLKVTIK